MAKEQSMQTSPGTENDTNNGKASKPWYKKKRIMIPLLLVVFIALAISGGDPETNSSSAGNEVATNSEEQKNTVGVDSTKELESVNAAPESAPEPADDTPELTASQKNAVRSAENYISFSGFSRQGLIDQLSSEYGDQYPVEDATIAVDSLNIDYNEQAKRSAETYLDMSGFSCQGLIDQLSSDAGDKYTPEQARSGAEAAGAC